MRVIAGKAKGMKLSVPKGWSGRPTLDRVREALFNILAPDIENSQFLDLFAGTGANGIEALSRGAANSTFVEIDNIAIEVIKENLEKTGLAQKATVIRCSSLKMDMSDIMKQNIGFDIIFADPPRQFGDYEDIIRVISSCALLKTEGIIVIEHAKNHLLDDAIAAFKRIRKSTYGNTCLSFFA